MKGGMKPWLLDLIFGALLGGLCAGCGFVLGWLACEGVVALENHDRSFQ